jgi:glycosyltransferase involved in cell wall biosynthesis
VGKVSIIIPVYNEVRTIGEILDKIRQLDLGVHEKEALIVDGASTDGTRELLLALTDPWVHVIHEDVRRGKGAAVVDGIRQASGTCIIIQDADSEYDPGDIPALVKPILDGQAQVVYGSRFRGEIQHMTKPRRMANKIVTMFVNILYGSRLTDACTCYKAMHINVARELGLESPGFDVCLEVTGKVLRRGYRVQELPISYFARTTADGIKSGWVDLVRALRTAVKYRFSDIGMGEPQVAGKHASATEGRQRFGLPSLTPDVLLPLDETDISASRSSLKAVISVVEIGD